MKLTETIVDGEQEITRTYEARTPRGVAELRALTKPMGLHIDVHRQALTEQRVREAIGPMLDQLIGRPA